MRHVPSIEAARVLPALLAVALGAAACNSRSRPVDANAIPLCERCHGGGGSAAPPRTARGLTDPSVRGVGAHRRHLELQPPGGVRDVRAALPCETCHAVPTPAEVYAHLDGRIQVRFLDPAAAGGAGARWNPQSGRCENVYCHGATLRDGSRGDATEPLWTVVDGSQMTCGSCHKAPPDSHAGYPGASSCASCHAETVNADLTINLTGGKHVNGTVDGPTGTGCALCHGAPPATGAHLLHATPPDPASVAYGSLAVLEDLASGGASYAFGCGHCHPTDPALHAAAAPLAQVVLGPPAIPVAGDEIKARNLGAAAYDATARTCSGVYCHSSGQEETPAYVVTPAWDAASGTLGCGGCHGNPPRYASGGPDSTSPNSHIGLAGPTPEESYEWGHFAGLPGAYHPSKHGGNNPSYGADPMQSSAPITCQACHADTVDPENVAPGGFFWLDTTGNYQLPGGKPDRNTNEAWLHSQCNHCHFAGGAPVLAGKVLPLRHVNGKRDVVFDDRRTLPVGYPSGLPTLIGADPDPTIDVRPYYVADLVTDDRGPADSVVRQTRVASDPPGVYRQAYTFTLEHASYNPVTRTCTNVACHLARQELVDTGYAEPLRWGTTYDGWACTGCHTY